MAVTSTVGDIYNTVCSVLLEPWGHGVYPGLSLGVVTQAQFFSYFSTTLEEFVGRTGLVWEIFTQQLNFNVGVYGAPQRINDINECFIGGQWIGHTTLQELDDAQYNWRSQMGTPDYWHEDGLPTQTLEVSANPNYNGASYAMPVPLDPTAQPPFGIYGLFNGATQGVTAGNVSIAGTTCTWVSGSQFDTSWNNYFPRPMMTIAGVQYQIDTVSSSTVLTLATAPSSSPGIDYIVSISNDGNLTMVGTKGIETITFTTDSIIPVIPDSLCFYLAYGILAKIFSMDGEVKDLQRAAYCLARYTEGINISAAISGQMIQE